MNEPFDTELSRGLKVGFSNSLSGLEFTPAMQQKVLERIAAEERRSVHPVPWFRSPRVLRPLALAAAAAAALVIAINPGIIGIGGRGTGADQGLEMSSLSMGDSTAPQNGVPSAMAPNASAPVPAPSLAPAPAMPGTAAAGEPSAEARGSYADSGLVTGAEAVVELPVVVAEKALNQGGIRSLGAPPPLRFRLEASGSGQVMVELSQSGLSAVDPGGVLTWQAAVEGVSAESRLAVSEKGRIAVSTDAKVLIFTLNGKLEQSRPLDGNVTALAWGGEESLAVAHGNLVTVLQATGIRFRVPLGNVIALSYAGDGTLAALSQQADRSSQLTLLSPEGIIRLNRPLTASASGLAFAGDGKAVVAGSQLLNREGAPLWEPPLQAEGMAALGPAAVVAWNREAAMRYDLSGRRIMYQARSGSPTAAIYAATGSTDGRYLLLSGRMDSGVMLWILNPTGSLLYHESVVEAPVDTLFRDDQLYLLFPDRIEVRDLNK